MRQCISVAFMPDIGTWWEYVARYSQGETQGKLANRIGVDTSTLTRWKDSIRPRAEHVVQFAREYGRSPIEALIHAGYIELNEVGKAIEVSGSMQDVSDLALIDELASRLADFRRIQTGRDNTQDWPPIGWRNEDARMRDVENRDNGR